MANENCETVIDGSGCHPVNATAGRMCGYLPEDYAEAALKLEPFGLAWCKEFGTIKAAIYRAFGGLLAYVDERICALVKESRPCATDEMLPEWEVEFGLPSDCMRGIYPTDIEGRKRAVCAAYLGQGIQTLPQMQAFLRNALDCPHLVLEINHDAGLINHVCVYNISATDINYVHNVVGGYGELCGVYGSSAGQPLQICDPDQVFGPYCSIVWHNVVGGWYGGVGQPLMVGREKWQLLICLMDKHLPAHVRWEVCN
jgi:uncharacterized protein YmfQ (DUF2313 family)